MASKIKISELPALTGTVADSYNIPIDDGSTTYKVSVAHFEEAAAGTASQYAAAAAASAEAAAGSAGEAATTATTIETDITTATRLVNDARGYASSAADSVTAAQAASGAATTKANEASNSANAAAGSAGEAAASATTASNYVTNAQAEANRAKSWADYPNATGSSGDATHNAHYWADVAQAIAGGGVTSFNGRGGVVVPEAGDYSAGMISYDNTDSGLTATDAQAAIDEVNTDLGNLNTEVGQIETDLSDKLDIADYAVTGAINFLAILHDTTTSYSVTYTVNRNANTVTVNGTPSGLPAGQNYSLFKTIDRFSDGWKVKAGRYFFSGCPSGGADNAKYKLALECTRNNAIVSLGTDTGNGVWVDVQDGDVLQSVIYIFNGYTANNLVFMPMLALNANMPNVPYAMTNRELTEKKEYNATFTTSEANVQTFVQFKAIRKGYIVNLQGYIKFTATFNAGSNIDGSFSNIPQPLFPCTSATFSGTSVFGANLSTDKTMRLRLPVQQVNGNSVFLNFTYFTEDLL